MKRTLNIEFRMGKSCDNTILSLFGDCKGETLIAYNEAINLVKNIRNNAKIMNLLKHESKDSKKITLELVKMIQDNDCNPKLSIKSREYLGESVKLQEILASKNIEIPFDYDLKNGTAEAELLLKMHFAYESSEYLQDLRFDVSKSLEKERQELVALYTGNPTLYKKYSYADVTVKRLHCIDMIIKYLDSVNILDEYVVDPIEGILYAGYEQICDVRDKADFTVAIDLETMQICGDSLIGEVCEFENENEVISGYKSESDGTIINVETGQRLKDYDYLPKWHTLEEFETFNEFCKELYDNTTYTFQHDNMVYCIFI